MKYPRIYFKDVELILENKQWTIKQKSDFLYNCFSEEENFDTFCYTIFPHAFPQDFADFHIEIIKEFMEDNDSVVAAPRGHGKSTLVGLGYLTWKLLYKKNRYIVYMSQNHSKTVQFLEPIRQELKNNKMIKLIYGTIKIMNVKDDEDINRRDREDCFDVNGCRVEAVSFEKNIRGFKYGVYRPDLIIFDDIDDDQRVLNPELRRKDEEKLNKQVIPSLDPKGHFKMIGTILHHECQLVKKLRLHNGKIYKAILPDGKALWPKRWTIEKLEAERIRIGGAAFQSEYLNTPVDDTYSLIKREWCKACCDSTLSYNDNGINYDKKITGVDFAYSDRVNADKSAFITIGKNYNLDCYDIIDLLMRKGMSITEQFDFIEYICGIQKSESALEENSIRAMSKELKNYNFKYTLFWTGAQDSTAKRQMDPEFDNKRHTVGKTAMINRLATQFENRRLRLPYKTEKDKELTNQLIDECCTYALQDGKLVEVGVHGDLPIALGYAVECAELEVLDVQMGILEM